MKKIEETFCCTFDQNQDQDSIVQTPNSFTKFVYYVWQNYYKCMLPKKLSVNPAKLPLLNP